jgi:hypothetical protein
VLAESSALSFEHADKNRNKPKVRNWLMVFIIVWYE